MDDVMKDEKSDVVSVTEPSAATEQKQPTPRRRRLDVGIDPEADPPMEAYRKCEQGVRELLSQFVEGEAEVNSLAAAVMTCALDYALTMARFYREARETHGAATDPSRAAGGQESSGDR